MDPQGLILGVLALVLGGILKGATGSGAPIVAVPVLVLLYDVPTAVAIMSMPNLVTNGWQGWRNRAHLGRRRFWLGFAAGGLAGAGIGSALLASLHSDVLVVMVAVFVICYIAFRLAHPSWSLARDKGEPLATPVGTVAGILFGTMGLSAPVSITFLNAMRLERGEFVATISFFFFTMGLAQVPLLLAFHILDAPRMALSILASLPILAGMPAGVRMARLLSPRAFDRVILVLLAVIALRMLVRVL